LKWIGLGLTVFCPNLYGKQSKICLLIPWLFFTDSKFFATTIKRKIKKIISNL